MVKHVTFFLEKAKSPSRSSPRKTSSSGTTPPRPPPRRKIAPQSQDNRQPNTNANASMVNDFLDDYFRNDPGPAPAPPPTIKQEKILPTTPSLKRQSDIYTALSSAISPRSLTNIDRAGRTARASRTRSAAISRTEMRLLANERASTDAGVPTYLRELLIRAKDRRPFTHYTALAHSIPISPDNRPEAAIDATVFFFATLPGKRSDLFAIEDFIRIKCPNFTSSQLHSILLESACIQVSEYTLSDLGHNLVPTPQDSPGSVILYSYNPSIDGSNSYRSIIFNWLRHEYRRLIRLEYSKESWVHGETCHPVERI